MNELQSHFQRMLGAASSKEISFNEVSQYSDWPERLLSLVDFGQRTKSEEEVHREYQLEKWADILNRVKGLESPDIETLDSYACNLNEQSSRYLDGSFLVTSEAKSIEMHLDIYKHILRPHLDGASALAELGAGYGSKLLHLGKSFPEIPLVAAEYAQAGQDIIKIMAESSERDLKVGACDFRHLTITKDLVPENAVIFTSYAACYVPQLSNEFVRYLAELKPKAVIHFEPFYEHYDSKELFDLMCKRYVELNDYTRNLRSVISSGEESGLIKVHAEHKKIIGDNPFLPISILEWSPV